MNVPKESLFGFLLFDIQKLFCVYMCLCICLLWYVLTVSRRERCVFYLFQ